MWLLWLRFVLSATVIIVAAINLSRNADIIAEKTGWGRASVGALLLPIATSLPEIVTSSQAAAVGNPDIALGNVFGSNMFNILIIAVVDLAQGSGPVLYYVGSGHILTAAIGILLTGMVCLAILAGTNVVLPYIQLGVDSVILLAVFAGGIRLITRYQRKNGKACGDEPQYAGMSLPRAVAWFAVAAGLIILAGRELAITADSLSQQTGLGSTFIGSFLVAVATSLPELTATMTAVRLGALDMAIGNILGANVMNMFIIVVSDIFYRPGGMLATVSSDNVIAGLLAIMLTGVAVIGLIYRSKKSVFYLGFDAVAIIGLYLLGAWLLLAAGLGL